MARRKNPPAHGSGRYLPLPLIVLRSEQFAALNPHAVKLLLDLMAQFNGFGNNGALSLAWKLMEARGWRSRDTLNKARKELLDRGWILCTRQGGRHRCSLYGVTFYRLDACSSKLLLDSGFGKEEQHPRGDWFRYKAHPPAQGNGTDPNVPVTIGSLGRSTLGGSIADSEEARIARPAGQSDAAAEKGGPSVVSVVGFVTRRAG